MRQYPSEFLKTGSRNCLVTQYARFAKHATSVSDTLAENATFIDFSRLKSYSEHCWSSEENIPCREDVLHTLLTRLPLRMTSSTEYWKATEPERKLTNGLFGLDHALASTGHRLPL